MHLALIGYRGSGKTSVGRALAARLGLAFVDADEELVRRAGRSIKAIFADEGEANFRDRESAVLSDLLDGPPAVLSLGGGVVLREANRQSLAASGATVVYLHATPQTLHARIHADPATAENRPALTHLGGGIEEIASLLAVRDPLYRSVATHTVDVENASVPQIVERIVDASGPLSRVPAGEG